MLVARLRVCLPAALLAAALAACGGSDKRLENLSVGISKDSVIQVMGVEKPRRIDPFLVNGHYIEAMYFPKLDADTGSIPDREMAPVVVIDGVLAGWGWKSWDSIAAANQIVVPNR
jgi:hypothetical protein